MIKKIFLILVILNYSCTAHFSGKSDYTVPFYKLKQDKEEYLKKIVEQEGETALEGEGGEYREYQRWLNFWQRRIAPNGTYQTYTESIYKYYKTEKSKSLNRLAGTPGNSDAWKDLGPFKRPNHGIPDIGGGHGDLGVGIIRDMVINRQNTNKILAWSLAGGLFVTNDKGLNWQNAGSDDWPRSGCSSADFSPLDPNAWYACSNIGGSYDNNSIGSGGGVYRTTDAGLNWTQIGDASSFTVTGAGTIINKILINPLNDAIAYVATRSGLYMSTNVNASAPSIPSWSLIHSGVIEDIEFRTDNSGTVIISTKNSSDFWTVEYSADLGATWTLLPSFPTFGTSSTRGLYIEVSDAASGRVYLWQRTTVNEGNLYIYDFNSNTWQFYLNQQLWQTGGPCFGVSNFNPDIIYLGYDVSFRKIKIGGQIIIDSYSANPALALQFHDDIESIVTPPASCPACSTEVYICTHGGVSYSNDECTTIYSRCDGLGIGKGDASNSATDPSKILVGLDHDGTVLSSGTYSNSWIPDWETVLEGDGMPPLIDYSNPAYTWAAYQQSVHQLSLTGGMANTYTSTIFARSNESTPRIYQNQVYPDIVYCYEEDNAAGYLYENLYRANNRGGAGATKEKISDFAGINLPADGWPDQHYHNNYSFEISNVYPTNDANIAYILLSTNGRNDYYNLPRWYCKVYKNTSMTAPAVTVQNSWVDMSLPPGKNKCDMLAIDGSNPHIAYIGYVQVPGSVELYKADYTNSANPTFINIAGTAANGGLPVVWFHTIVTEKGSNGGIYVTTEVGIFYSNNTMLDFSGANNSQWIKIGTNLPNIPINSMEINYPANKLRVSTSGRGIWEHDLYCPVTDFYTFTTHPASNNFFEAVNSITSAASIPPANTINYRAGTYIELNPGFSADPASNNYFHAFIHPCSSPGNSFK